ncbi:2-oxo-4-hydroxy-4-carboxy-5-ureidoimidazoline decarboxylase [Antrihabitans cavernicola]|uniref:OHCU decarboxylase n=1 Tax=Antrihabitans cavernicola TaxID=2495913 RepID=A0A5A7SFR7_9NOCA|nr:2-oxo-4-hydroxy-4-carboxy-5-ureidoimidazoline decarboxylase [Spelaeibacter cavernicola]KAA0024414.1 OHCU decarboxylase [Spelaeibacter cavernicola]
MLMHQGIGLDRFNALPRTHARHALFECCCSVVWADKLADARPYDSYATLFTHADSELSALSDTDIDTVMQGYRNLIDDHAERKACYDELARINRIRIKRMLGPEEGYPDY